MKVIKAAFIVLATIAVNMSVANASRDWSSFQATLKEKLKFNELYKDNDVSCWGGGYQFKSMWKVSTGAKASVWPLLGSLHPQCYTI